MSAPTVSETTAISLLGPGDPPPATVLNPEGRAQAVVVCDHGGDAIPGVLDGLGLDAAQRARHIAWDIGAKAIAQELSRLLDAPAVLGNYSRLVIDLNRPPDDLTSIREISDGTVVPGNRNLSEADGRNRLKAIFEPYHGAVESALNGVRRRVAAPALVSVHSFTPVMKGVERPWHIGVLFGPDDRIARPLMEALSRNADICVGENKPYSGYDLYGHTVETHALPVGLPNVLFEIRQDLIDTQQGVAHWSVPIAAALREVLADETLYRPFGHVETDI